MSLWWLLAACAVKSPSPAPPGPMEPVAEALGPSEPAAGPEALPSASDGTALAPRLLSQSVEDCESGSPLCAAVRCEVENLMSSGFPTRWTLGLAVDDRREVHTDLRWVVPPASSEVRRVELSLAAFSEARCAASAGANVSSRAAACPGEIECVEVVCSVYRNAAAAPAYVDVHLVLPDGASFDRNAVYVDVPANGDVVQHVVRYTPGAQGWTPGRSESVNPLPLQPRCGYWDGLGLIQIVR